MILQSSTQRRINKFCRIDIEAKTTDNKWTWTSVNLLPLWLLWLFSTCDEVGVGGQQRVAVVGFPERRPPQQALVRLLHPQALVHQLLHEWVPLRWACCHPPDGPAASGCLLHLLFSTISCQRSPGLPQECREECMKGEGRRWCHSWGQIKHLISPWKLR